MTTAASSFLESTSSATAPAKTTRECIIHPHPSALLVMWYLGELGSISAIFATYTYLSSESSCLPFLRAFSSRPQLARCSAHLLASLRVSITIPTRTRQHDVQRPILAGSGRPSRRAGDRPAAVCAGPPPGEGDGGVPSKNHNNNNNEGDDEGRRRRGWNGRRSRWVQQQRRWHRRDTRLALPPDHPDGGTDVRPSRCAPADRGRSVDGRSGPPSTRGRLSTGGGTIWR